MEPTQITAGLRVSFRTVEAFARASGDVSPLHTDAAYARRTSYGEPIVHGVLGVLLALAAAPPRPGARLTRLRARFTGPMLCDHTYALRVEKPGSGERNATVLRVLDGPRGVLEIDAMFRPGNRRDTPPGAGPDAGSAADTGGSPALRLAEIIPGRPVGTAYRPDWAALRELLTDLRLADSGLDIEHVAVLAWASYVSGMQAPGRAGTSSGVEVEFEERPRGAETDPGFAADARVADVDERFRRVRVAGELTSGSLAARVAVTAFVRREAEPSDPARLRALLGEAADAGTLAGRVAVVTGGSRGLGGALVQALALAGCTVYAVFRDSRSEAEALVARLGPAGSRVHLAQGDASDVAWCGQLREQVLAAHGRLDALILNATPPLRQSLGVDGDSASRAADHVAGTLALAHAPLAAFGADLAAAAGWTVAVSCSAVRRPVPGWSHVVTAKFALEGLVESAAVEYPTGRYLVVRPPRMRTTFADASALRDEARPVEPIAAAIVRQLTADVPPGGVRLVEDIPEEPAPTPAGSDGTNAGAPGTETSDAATSGTATPETGTPDAATGATPPPAGSLVVAATFTTDPLRGVLDYWSAELGLGLTVELAPYGQIFQELLDPSSTFARNEHGCNVVLLRMEDWPPGEEAERCVTDLVEAVRAYADRASVPLAVLDCPSSPAVERDRADELRDLRQRLASGLAGLGGVFLVDPNRWHGGFPVSDHHDAARDELAHIPYTPTAYTALGTGVARAVHGILAPPFKALVLDCDNTLWSGVAGEDGPGGVAVRDAHRHLQERAVALQGEGMLVCLCSKNSEADVDEVFRSGPAMPLQPEHVAARRVNWQSKADNVAALADELGIGLDSFVFVDDNPVEVAAVRAAHPEVLALRLPESESEVPGFVDRLWAFDRSVVTAEDRARTSSYRAGLARARARRAAGTFAAFIEGLQLSVDVHPARPDQLDRVAQLTQRTNQFNLTTVRRTEPQVRALAADGARCWVAEVRDRFGDYGLVGAAITREHPTDEGVLLLDTLLLSCRVLGRGVEHAFLAAVGRGEAERRPGAVLEIGYAPTPRNAPARDFCEAALSTVDAVRRVPGEDGGVVYRLPCEQVAAVSFRPGDEPGESAGSSPAHAPRPRPTTTLSPRHERRLAALTALCESGDLADLHARVTAAAPATERGAEPREERPAAERSPGPVSASAPEPAAGVGPSSGSARGPAPGRGSPGVALAAVREVLQPMVRLSPEQLDAETTLESLRLTSLEIVDATVGLERRYGRLPRTLFFEHRTLGSLAAALPGPATDAGPSSAAEPRPPVPPPPPVAPATASPAPPPVAAPEPRPDGIAVVGLAGRFPGARDVQAFWQNLLAEEESVSDAAERWDAAQAAVVPPLRVGLVDGVAEFDAPFFSIAPSEARTMDPQQRLFLQAAYHAMQDAGHTPAGLGRRVGVYVGAVSPDYLILSAEAALDGRSRYPNTDLYQIANRVSHVFDFTGPSLTVDTACSAAGVALQLACEAIRNGTVSAAVAGGVHLVLHPSRQVQYAQVGMVSPQGRCSPFGAAADGIVTGEGVGAVLLRPLADALADGDHVYGVIRAVGVNSEGRTNGFTVPSPDAQAELVSRTLAEAGFAPDTVGYVEAHGTGTPLGDPVEVRGLTQAFGPVAAPCPIGSVKGNIGHLVSAAAMPSLTKVLLQLRHGTLVPSLHAEETNPHIDFAETPFRVQRTTAPWPRPANAPRRATVSSFGAGGVNVHIAVEEAPSAAAGGAAPAPSNGPELVVLSARAEEQLWESCALLATHLRGPGADLPLADVAFTLREGREEFVSRVAFPVAGREELLEVLDRLAEDGPATVSAATGGTVSHGRVGEDSAATVFDGSPGTAAMLSRLASAGDLSRLGHLWTRGARVDWAAVLPGAGRRRVSLPGYPFRRIPHWLPDREQAGATGLSGTPNARTGAGGTEPADTAPEVRLYRPAWRAVEPVAGRAHGLDAEGARVVVVGSVAPGWARGTSVLPDLDRESMPPGNGDELVVVDVRPATGAPAPLPTPGVSGALATVARLARLAPDGPRVTYVAVCRSEERDPAAAALSGFGAGLAHETERLRVVRVELPDAAEAGTPQGGEDLPPLPRLLAATRGGAPEVRLDGSGRCWLPCWRDLPPAAGAAPLRSGGRYLITGGTGGIGRLLARHLVSRYRARVVLLGRSGEDRVDLAALRAEARAAGGEALYLRADVADPVALGAAVATARERLGGGLHGVVHAAGVLHDGLQRDTSDAELRRVLAPKVDGVVWLDRATAADELDFFVLMSSVAGVLGNAGQADYAAANRFLDAFARHRAAAVTRGERHGRSTSVLWPLWEEGGMRMPPSARRLAATTLGLHAVATSEALDAFERALAAGEPAVFVGSGDQRRIRAALAGAAGLAGAGTAGRNGEGDHAGAARVPAARGLDDPTDPGGTLPAPSEPDTRAALRDRLRKEAAGLAELPAGDLDTGVELGEYGFTSVLFVDLANRVNEMFGLAVTPVLFFEHQTVDALTAALLDRHRAAVSARMPAGDPVPEAAPVPAPTPLPASPVAPRMARPPSRQTPIAVVGLAGRFPGSPDVAAYWRALLTGRSLTGPAPMDRQDGDTPWPGGYLDDVTGFDAPFFGIPPREARLMDPQQRLLLETTWHALEDAGYDPRALGGSPTGVFVGASLQDYAELLSGNDEPVVGHTVTGTMQSILANRISYLLDLRGPSEVADTACSSSLTAIHRAIGSLTAGECETAVAGGVNLLLSPRWFTSLNDAGMLSPTGRCWSFDARADGFVRGEGVGVVVLKTLERARADGDTVRAVIHGSAVNHGGRSHSLTAPNPEAQADAVVAALEAADMDPHTVTYVETHGTGTRLGDPVEVAGLAAAFARGGATGTDAPWCGLGAVKSTLGHLEAAAGIAGLLKVVLAIQHRTLPANAAGDQPHPDLGLAGTPFFLLNETRPWRPVDADGATLPLRAGLSSFGFGGTNAHLVVGEPPPAAAAGPAPPGAPGADLVVLSASEPERLREQAARLRLALDADPHPLADLAHTSRVGRTPLPARLAVVAGSTAELAAALDRYLAGGTSPDLHTGRAGDAPDPADAAAGSGRRPGRAGGDQEAELHRLARRWVTGGTVTWPSRPGARRVPLPCYPFDHRTRYGFTTPLTRDPVGRRHVTEPTGTPAGESADGSVPQLLARSWDPCATPTGATGELAGRPTCLVVVGGDQQLALLEELAGTTQARWIVLREPSRLPALAADEYELDFDDHAAGRRVAEQIVKRHGPLDALVDLVDLVDGPVDAAGSGTPLGREAGRVGVLQTLAASGRVRGLRVVHLTRGLGTGGPDGGGGPALAGARMAGLVRAVGAEYAAVRTCTVDLDPAAPSGLTTALRELAGAGDQPEVRYRDGVRQVPRLTPVALPASPGVGHLGTFPVDPHRTYLITGGTGGLGLAAAELLVARGARRLVLTGRRPLPPRQEWPRTVDGTDVWWREPVAAIQRMERAGARIVLGDGSLSDGPRLAALLAETRSRLGPVAGVLHCAGTVGPTPAFVDKPYEEIAATWEPKGEALLALDAALAEDEPDFVVSYSSLSAVVPALAVGLADYASGNALLDVYAADATRRARRRGARTRYLALDWGSWSGIGMGEVSSPRYRERGLAALSRAEGLALLEAALATPEDTHSTSLVALRAAPDAADRLLVPDDGERHGRLAGATAEAPGGAAGGPAPDPLVARCATHVRGVLAHALGVPEQGIGADVPFAELGVDSILIAGVVTRLESVTGAPVEPSVVLEHPTVSRLAAHLVDRYGDGLARGLTGPDPSPLPDRDPAGHMDTETDREADTDAGVSASASTGATERAAPRAVEPTGGTAPGGVAPIAVIGMAGRFPGAVDTGALWTLLREGRSGVRVVPPSRWEAAEYYTPEARPGRTVSKWGGFLDGVEDFDPAHFGIAETDAAHLDPLTRLFLECAEETLADAGYRGEDLAGRRVGVFVGSGTSSYGFRIPVPERATATGLNQNMIAAHLAQVHDLRGPNLVVDTACSSSLTSLYLAQQALRLGECETALAGGVDLLLDETPYLRLSAAGALSPDGVCRVFDAGANGFVPGEGVGAVLLKPLARALADGDRIHAVIEAVAVNNDGRTMGLTTPNPDAQRAVVLDAFAKAGVDAASVSYVEAHGTGTLIGDPIELKALTRVFRSYTEEQGFCGVGSVKSNIGHLQMAAGMASLQKVVLSLRHQMLPPTLHCERPNPRFAFAESPFHPVTELVPWQPRRGVRRAGISAFGFGGTNCHAVVREVTEAERAAHPARRRPLPPPAFRRSRHWVERPPHEAAPDTHAGTAGNGANGANDGAATEPARAGLSPILVLEEGT
ncbi:SDR family NAD(P)-dependent oxidoreductase [Streptomyces sp. MAR4 CNY-716]